MKKETKDTWAFRGMMAIVIMVTIFSIVGCGVVGILRFIKRIFGGNYGRGWKGEIK